MAAKGEFISIGGYKVYFPLDKKPFPQQLACMSKCIQACRSSTNALLESPTGTGKTLALLCSTLSWQLSYSQHLETLHARATENGVDNDSGNSCNEKTTKPPKVFFASRTHSQIGQVSKVLKSLPPALIGGLRSTILGSREHYCVHPKLTSKQRKVDKTEECNKMLNGNHRFSRRTGCQYYLGQGHLRKVVEHQQPIWDIEDLVEMGKRHQGCPFFVSRELSQVQIVLCPYNYLIDPRIRASMDLNNHLRDAVVVIDEAHNIEDVCRDAASFSVCSSQLEIVADQLEKMSEHGPQGFIQAHQDLGHFIRSVVQWTHSLNLSTQPTTWDGVQVLAVWLAPQTEPHLEFEAIVDKLIAQFGKAQSAEEQAQPGEITLPANPAQSTLDGLLTALHFMCSEGGQYIRDFKIVVSVEEPTNTSRDATHHISQSVNIQILCLNPALAFTALESQCRSIILASGTLSPLDSFASELGVHFPQRYEGGHVINTEKQLLAHAISYGFGDKGTEQLLEATFKTSKHASYQIALGNALCAQLASIPKSGALCFFPSYSLLNRCVEKWKSSGIWKKMRKARDQIFIEPRVGGPKFDTMLSKFRKGSVGTTTKPCRGTLFFCVFRGKLAEGIDFPDDAARAVFIVGIPFPSLHDDAVKLKKQYQDNKLTNFKRSGGAGHLLDFKPLSGRQWYMQQAFRALNQAIGRCIRHKNDYGAIVFLDHRFANNDIRDGLSKWARSSLRALRTVQHSHSGLESFFLRARECFTQQAIAEAPSVTIHSTTTDARHSLKSFFDAGAPRSNLKPGTIPISTDSNSLKAACSKQGSKEFLDSDTELSAENASKLATVRKSVKVAKPALRPANQNLSMTGMQLQHGHSAATRADIIGMKKGPTSTIVVKKGLSLEQLLGKSPRRDALNSSIHVSNKANSHEFSSVQSTGNHVTRQNQGRKIMSPVVLHAASSLPKHENSNQGFRVNRDGNAESGTGSNGTTTHKLRKQEPGSSSERVESSSSPDSVLGHLHRRHELTSSGLIRIQKNSNLGNHSNRPNAVLSASSSSSPNAPTLSLNIRKHHNNEPLQIVHNRILPTLNENPKQRTNECYSIETTKSRQTALNQGTTYCTNENLEARIPVQATTTKWSRQDGNMVSQKSELRNSSSGSLKKNARDLHVMQTAEKLDDRVYSHYWSKRKKYPHTMETEAKGTANNIKDSPFMSQKGLVSNLSESATNPKGLTSNLNDSTTDPKDLASKHKDSQSMCQNDLASNLNDSTTNPKDLASKYNDSAISPKDLASNLNDSTTNPKDLASKHNDSAISPKGLATLVHTSDLLGLACHLVQQVKLHASPHLEGNTIEDKQVFFNQLLTGIALEARKILGESNCQPIIDSLAFTLGDANLEASRKVAPSDLEVRKGISPKKIANSSMCNRKRGVIKQQVQLKRSVVGCNSSHQEMRKRFRAELPQFSPMRQQSKQSIVSDDDSDFV